MSNYIVDGSDLTSVANAIRAKSGGSGQLAFPSGFVSEIGNIPSGGGGGGLTLLGSGTYTKASDSTNITIPVTFTGTPKEYFYYNTTPAAATQQTLMGYNRVLDGSDFASLLPDGELICAHRIMTNSGAIGWSSSAQVITLSATQMSCSRPGSGNTHKAGTWKWYIYGEAAT